MSLAGLRWVDLAWQIPDGIKNSLVVLVVEVQRWFFESLVLVKVRAGIISYGVRRHVYGRLQSLRRVVLAWQSLDKGRPLSTREDLNFRHSAYKTDALISELLGQAHSRALFSAQPARGAKTRKIPK